MTIKLTREQVVALVLAAESTVEDYAASGESAPRALQNAIAELNATLGAKG